MLYMFVINGRADKTFIRPDVEKQLEGLDIQYQLVTTRGPGEGTRIVNLYCDLHPEEEVCFVACGGSGTANEVASGIVGRPNKYMAFMGYGGTNDLLKCFPGRNFLSIKDILNGERTKIDAIKVNESYSINVVNVGMDAMVAYFWEIYNSEGVKGSMPKSLARAILSNRVNHIKVVADGEVLSKRTIMQATVSNGKVCGGQFVSSPHAILDDGWMEVSVFKTMILPVLLYVLPRYEKGTHLDNKRCMRHIKYRQVKHVELFSKELIHLSLDGENIASSHFTLDMLEKSVNFILPPLQ